MKPGALPAPLPCLALSCLIVVQTVSTSALCEPASFTRMHMVYTKGLFLLRVPVFELEIRFNEETAAHFRQVAAEGKIGSESRERVAQAALDARHASIHLRFLRSLEMKRFLEQTKRSLELVRKRRRISTATLDRLLLDIPEWYAFLSDRGILEGDEIHYQIAGETVRILYTEPSGQVLMDRNHSGEEDRSAVLGCYLVKGSDFRKPLIESLFPR